ncbi:glycosyltransferase [Candidatus Woesearchaeota archaeon]|nr:glycosyltransferase [Candidatus Woesearchaeota archaeon]
MKNLLIASDRFLPEKNGLVRFLQEIIPFMQNKYNISLLIPKTDKFENNTGIDLEKIKTIDLPTHKFQVADYTPPKLKLSKIKNAIRNAEIVWINSCGIIGLTSLHYAKKYNKPTYVYTHCQDWDLVHQSIKVPRYIGKIFRKIALFVLKRYYNRSTLMVPSTLLGEKLSNLGFNSEKIVVPLGIDKNKFRPATENEKFIAKQRLKLDNKLVIGYIGRIALEKDLATLNDAFKILKKELKKDISLMLIGDGPGKHKRIFEKDILITGYVENVHEYLKAVDIFVLPSLTETSSLATMEAMASGIPVVTTKVGSIPNYIKDMDNGLFFEAGDANDLVSKLFTLIINKEMYNSISKNAHETMKDLNWENTASLIDKELEK